LSELSRGNELKRYKYIIVLDTEFVSSKEGEQPIQISFIAFEIKQDKLMKISDFNVYVRLREGMHLNYFARKITGITEERLLSNGIYPNMATQQVISFLLMFNVDETLIIGWAPQNDKKMLNKLMNQDEPLINLDAFDWFDLSKSYKKLNNITDNGTPAFKDAMEFYNVKGYHYHDSMEDARATAFLLGIFLKEHGIEKVIYEVQRMPVTKKKRTHKHYLPKEEGNKNENH
jgi:inhibitor of KinA sporulation pathway (predicted exonuclease)